MGMWQKGNSSTTYMCMHGQTLSYIAHYIQVYTKHVRTDIWLYIIEAHATF